MWLDVYSNLSDLLFGFLVIWFIWTTDKRLAQLENKKD